MSTIDPSTSTTNGRLVVVGSSAGGVEALSKLVGTLPTDFPAPIVLAQHLNPSHPSHLNTILQRLTSLPVQVVTAHTRLQAGVIYVVPPNRHVSIDDGYVDVQEDHLGRPKPSVDLLLSSAAKSYGERLIAVILTGAGSDGAVGALEVKHAGGIVIIQNPQTARFPSMPLALPPTIVDVQVDIERIAPLLYNLLTRKSMPSDDEMQEVLTSIFERVKEMMHIDLRIFRRSALQQHLRYRMLATGTPTAQSYLDYLREVPAEAKELVTELLVMYTPFFRDPEVFAYLKKTLLPELITKARDQDCSLRFWVAGCATGEEAYSLVMLLADLLGSAFSEWKIKVFATDISEEAITFARRGVYAENTLTGLPADYKERFFERSDHGYRLTKELRQKVVFGLVDLSLATPFPAIDLVLCRNVLRYFTPEIQEQVLNQFAFSIFPYGFLMLGKAETLRPSQARYETVNRELNVYRCMAKAATSSNSPKIAAKRNPHVNEQAMHQPLPAAALSFLPTSSSVVQPETAPTLELGSLPSFQEQLWRSLPIGVVVIDRNYHIITANRLSRHLLRLPPEAAELDFLHSVPGLPYTEVRTAIDAVLKERNTLSLPEVELDVTRGGTGCIVALSISPIQLDVALPELVAVSVIDVTELVKTRRHFEDLQAEQRQLVDELGAANTRLREANQALMSTNEELQASNEELIVIQEEFQTKMQEYETTNQELQSDLQIMEGTNEELETTFEELEATNEQLQVREEEFYARTGELQEEITRLAKERRRLGEIMECAPYALVVLQGPGLRVQSANTRAGSWLKVKDVQGQPLAEIAGLLWENDSSIVSIANEVYKQDSSRSISCLSTFVPLASGETVKKKLAYTLVPAHAADGTVCGVIVYATDEVEVREQVADNDMQRNTTLP